MCYPFSVQLASGPPLLLPAGPPHALNSFSFFRRFGFDDTGSAKNRSDHGIALVACPLVHRPLCLRPGHFRGPGFGPRCGIFDRELVNHRVVGSTREAFDEMQLFAGSSKWGAIREIRGVDHQRITLPMSYRVPLPQADILWNMRTAVGGDDARGVVDLVKQAHVSLPLDNLQQVAFVSAGPHGELFLAHQDATLT